MAVEGTACSERRRVEQDALSETGANKDESGKQKTNHQVPNIILPVVNPGLWMAQSWLLVLFQINHLLLSLSWTLRSFGIAMNQQFNLS